MIWRNNLIYNLKIKKDMIIVKINRCKDLKCENKIEKIYWGKKINIIKEIKNLIMNSDKIEEIENKELIKKNNHLVDISYVNIELLDGNLNSYYKEIDEENEEIGINYGLMKLVYNNKEKKLILNDYLNGRKISIIGEEKLNYYYNKLMLKNGICKI